MLVSQMVIAALVAIDIPVLIFAWRQSRRDRARARRLDTICGEVAKACRTVKLLESEIAEALKQIRAREEEAQRPDELSIRRRLREI